MSEKDTVSLPKEQVDAILEDNKSMKAQLSTLMEAIQSLTAKQNEGMGPKVFRQIKERKVRVMFIDGKPVIGFVNRGTDARPSFSYEKPDPMDNKNRLLYVDLILAGVAEPLSVNFNEFLREGERVECVVKSKDDKPWSVEHGQVRQKMVDEYSMVETDVLVPLEVNGTHSSFTVEIPSTGELLTVDESVVNIT